MTWDLINTISQSLINRPSEVRICVTVVRRLWPGLIQHVDAEEVRRKCIAHGNDLTFAKAKEIV